MMKLMNASDAAAYTVARILAPLALRVKIDVRQPNFYYLTGVEDGWFTVCTNRRGTPDKCWRVNKLWLEIPRELLSQLNA